MPVINELPATKLLKLLQKFRIVDNWAIETSSWYGVKLIGIEIKGNQYGDVDLWK